MSEEPVQVVAPGLDHSPSRISPVGCKSARRFPPKTVSRAPGTPAPPQSVAGAFRADGGRSLRRR